MPFLLLGQAASVDARRRRGNMPFAGSPPALYDPPMNASRKSAARMAALGGLTAALAAMSGMAFAGWLGQGGDMLVSLAASGLSWCF